MSTLDLTPEIFERVIHELVSSAGAKEAWKLRGTCRTFAASIRTNILSQQPQNVIRPSNKSLQPLLNIPGNLIVYLHNKVKYPLDANLFLPRRMKAMSEWLCSMHQEFYGNCSQYQRDQIFWLVSKLLATRLTMKQIDILLYGDTKTYSFLSTGTAADSIDVIDKLGVAVCLQRGMFSSISVFPGPHLLTRLLPQFRFDDLSGKVNLFGDMFGNAISEYRRQLKHEGPHVEVPWMLTVLEDYILRSTDPQACNEVEIMMYLSSRPTTTIQDFPLYDECSWDPKPGAIESVLDIAMGPCMKLGSSKLLNSLFHLQDACCPKLTKSSYNRWLGYAINSNHIECVRMMLRRPCPSKPRVTFQNFRLACGTSPKIVAAMFEESAIKPNQKLSRSSPLLVAINHGLEVVNVVLSAGADPNLKVRNWTPLNTASCNNYVDVLKALLLAGADPTKAGFFRYNEETRINELLKELKIERGDYTSSPEVTLSDPSDMLQNHHGDGTPTISPQAIDYPADAIDNDMGASAAEEPCHINNFTDDQSSPTFDMFTPEDFQLALDWTIADVRSYTDLATSSQTAGDFFTGSNVQGDYDSFLRTYTHFN